MPIIQTFVMFQLYMKIALVKVKPALVNLAGINVFQWILQNTSTFTVMEFLVQGIGTCTVMQFFV